MEQQATYQVELNKRFEYFDIRAPRGLSKEQVLKLILEEINNEAEIFSMKVVHDD